MIEEEKSARFAIYRGAEARDYAEHGIMNMEGLTPVIAAGLASFRREPNEGGQLVKMLFSAPGFSLTYVWFKSGYPLPLHSHRSDCLYYILAGSLKMGSEELGPGDGFFVGSDVPYTYTPGPQGVEVLEFRNSDQLNIRFLGKTKAVWDKTVARMDARRADWVDEVPPTQAAGR